MKQYSLYYDMVEKALSEAIPLEGNPPPDGGIPGALGEAMAYSLLAGGKRIRPVILLAAYHLEKPDIEQALPFAVALEMIHTYSLIHDDLPTMDDDDLRRGKPTNHKVYGEALAILAGDGLLNMAFETMLGAAVSLGTKGAVAAAEALARRAGARGMIAGQVMDVRSEGKAPESQLVAYIHRHKTAALFMAAMEAGLLLAEGGDEKVQAGGAYGYHMGMAFQMEDDLLDISGNAAVLGKETGMDALREKLTWPACVGEAQTRRDMADHIEKAKEALAIFDENGNFLAALAQSTLNRVQ